MKSPLRPLLLAAAFAAAASLAHAAPGAVAPILTTPEARDAKTFARPEIARVTHVDLDLAADFEASAFSGTATLDVLAAPGAQEIVLDDLGLQITKVTDGEGRALPWSVGAQKDGELGAPLTIQLKGAKKIVITYVSAPGARALQWLPPSLTAGKRKPLLFSQGQSINNRSWIPTQDSPGIRQTWSARIVVPEGLVAVMSGDKLTPKGEPAGSGKMAYRFKMDHPVPPYLIAIAIGDLAFKPLGPRTGVYTEPSMIERAAYELADTEKMVEAAEALYGPYRWGRYDVLVLPPAFPLGGMENPTLTFLTPTFITGDRANTSLVAHELAHSWSGNLVTNATWPDSWLNEGFTTYFENRIMEALYGPERARIEAELDWDGMMADIEDAGGMSADGTRLHGQTAGQLEYFKGAIFLRTLENAIGRDRWDAYLRSYFDRHAFQPQTTAGFLADLRANLIKGDKDLEAKLRLDEWAHEPGVPSNAFHTRSEALARVDQRREAFLKGAPASALQTGAWTTQEWQRFLDNLPRKLTRAQLDDLDRAFKLSDSTNGYVRSAWLEIAIANRYEPAIPSIEQFLTSVGRILFLRPLYAGLMKDPEWGQPIARRVFAQARAGYHPTAERGLARMVEGK
jgi:aminopeptidase N